MAEKRAEPQRFTAFQGVFRPNVLTILGALFYLREGWLVGNNGLFGAILVLLGAYAITGTTALSISSVATNVRVRPGGAFAIISQALGLEAGGAIGIPLFIAQAASSAMYLYAFTEAWGYLFPSHDPTLVVTLAFLLVAGVAWRSAGLAFKAQAVMLGVVVLAISSAFLGVFTAKTLHSPQLVARFPEASLLRSFAIFFPAATGIMVGVGMSGALADPQSSIPRGTLGAWAVTGVVYLLGAIWYSVVASPEELLTNKTVMVDKALFGPLVLLGLISSTLMAALSSLVAAPRLLAAMAEHRVVPFGDWLSRTEQGEPRNAALITLGIGALGLLSGSLDAIAPIITSFFLLTFLGVNLVVFLEQRLAMISFRPTFSIPSVVPVVGMLLCLFTLSLASPIGGLPELALVALIYGGLVIRQLDTPWETVRSGIPVALADWAARAASGMQRGQRAWKPDLLVPVRDPKELRTLDPLLRAITTRSGSAKLLGVGDHPELPEALDAQVQALRDQGVHAAQTRVEGTEFHTTLRTAIELLQVDLFPPNLLVVDASHHPLEHLQDLVEACRTHQMGMVLVMPHPDHPLKPGGDVDVWVSDQGPDWQPKLQLVNLDLQILLGWLLGRAMDAQLRLITVLRNPDDAARAEDFLRDMVAMGRLPPTTGQHVMEGDFLDVLTSAPSASVHLFGMPGTLDLDLMRKLQAATGGTLLFLLDSGQESALA